MVLFLLVLSVLLLLIAIALYRVPPGANLAVLAIAALLSYGVLSFSARTLILIFPCLAATYLVCRWRDVSRGRYAAFATASVAAGWVAAMLLFLPRWNEIQRLAADYPAVRVDERLAYERKETRNLATPPDSTDSTVDGFPTEAALEEAVDWAWHRQDRAASLASLERTHGSYVDAFISQEGFGWIRMRFLPPRDEYIRTPEPEPLALSPPVPASDSAGAADDAQPIEGSESYRDYHGELALDFVNPKTYGYAVDGEWDVYGRMGATEIRGFQPHAFSTVPSGSPAGDEWQLARLELVSLLKHDPPAAYLSEHLPRMRDLANDNAPTRPLNAFETRALLRLRDGETIVAAEGRNRISMFGGLRAARQCLQCHSVREGHLLGAFSYEFLRKEPLPPPDEKPTPPKPVT